MSAKEPTLGAAIAGEGVTPVIAKGGPESGGTSWSADPWGPCMQDAMSESADVCVSTRAVGCVDESGILVALSLCEDADMPAMEKSCECDDDDTPDWVASQDGAAEEASEWEATPSISGLWRADDWGPCVHVREGDGAASNSCQRTRFVSCVDAAGRTVSSSECDLPAQPHSLGPCDCKGEDESAVPLS